MWRDILKKQKPAKPPPTPPTHTNITEGKSKNCWFGGNGGGFAVFENKKKGKLKCETATRRWQPGNPHTCDCGYSTGWTYKGQALCPVCYHNTTLQEESSQASPVAMQWVNKHQEALIDAGWTLSELYSSDACNPGIVWLPMWEQPFALTWLHEDGTIEFEAVVDGVDSITNLEPINNSRR